MGCFVCSWKTEGCRRGSVSIKNVLVLAVRIVHKGTSQSIPVQMPIFSQIQQCQKPKKRHPQLGSMFLNVFFDASEQKEEKHHGSSSHFEVLPGSGAKGLVGKASIAENSPNLGGFRFVEVPGNKSACQKVRKTIIFTPRNKSEARCFKEGSEIQRKKLGSQRCKLDLQSPHLAQHSQTSTKVSLIAKPESKLKTKLIAAT